MPRRLGTDDVDDTARLILMDLHPKRDAYRFIKQLRAEHPTLTLAGALSFWSKYMGMDDRSFPTHDFWTGERI